MNITIHWYFLIKLVRFLSWIGADNAAEWVGEKSGLKAHVIAFLESEGINTSA